MQEACVDTRAILPIVTETDDNCLTAKYLALQVKPRILHQDFG